MHAPPPATAFPPPPPPRWPPPRLAPVKHQHGLHGVAVRHTQTRTLLTFARQRVSGGLGAVRRLQEHLCQEGRHSGRLSCSMSACIVVVAAGGELLQLAVGCVGKRPAAARICNGLARPVAGAENFARLPRTRRQPCVGLGTSDLPRAAFPPRPVLVRRAIRSVACVASETGSAASVPQPNQGVVATRAGGRRPRGLARAGQGHRLQHANAPSALRTGGLRCIGPRPVRRWDDHGEGDDAGVRTAPS